MRRSLLWVVALALTASVGCVAVDAAQRWATLGTNFRYAVGRGTVVELHSAIEIAAQ